jgi:hypothetical protein
MDLQRYFNDFHEQIKLGDENVDLRTSRDAIKNRLSATLKDIVGELDVCLPVFFDQGSYAMGTGIKPISGKTTFDIDEGVIFDINKAYFSDPVEVKKWLTEALSDQTKLGTEIKEPCVRVIYSEDGEEKYHVDLAVYAREISSSDTPLNLARGKEYSLEENKYWDISDPIRLKNLINDKFSDDERAQFRRIIRYLKRWKDVQFSWAGKGKPTGISLTAAVYYYFSPFFDSNHNPSDIYALLAVLNGILAGVSSVNARIQIFLPVSPNNDLLSKMTEVQNNKFIEKMRSLRDDVVKVVTMNNINEALALLASHFGDDFPIEPSDTQKVAIIAVKKPSLGYFPSYSDPGVSLSEEKIKLYGYLKLRNQVSKTPLVSDKKVLSIDHNLIFRAEYDGEFDQILWQVVNTGNHAYQEYSSGRNKNAFRGSLEEAKVPNTNPSKFSKNSPYKKSLDPLQTWEHTEYTGKHWIQCFAFKNRACIAKSKKFFVNIYNPEFPNYD